MRTPRWLAALLVIALLLSSAPASVQAASVVAAPQQAPPIANALSYLLLVTPPAVLLPAHVRGFDAAGYVSIQHARRYAEVQAQLEALQAQGAIARFTALPAAYAFAVHDPDANARAVLAQLGRMQANDELSASAVDELRAVYQRQLSAAVGGSERRPLWSEPAQPPPPLSSRPQPAVVAARTELRAAAVATPAFVVDLNGNGVAGSGVAPGTTAVFTLKSGSGILKGRATATADENGYVSASLLDVYGGVANAAAGDVLEVQSPDLVTIPIVGLQLIPDLAARRISGFGPPNVTSTDFATLPNLELQIGGAGGYVTTTATGAFAAEDVPLLPDSVGWLVYTDAQGHSVRLHFFMPALAARGQHGPWWFDSYVGPNYVYGALSGSDALVTVTLTRAGSLVVANHTRSFNDGWFSLSLQDTYGNAVPILPGDTLQAANGLITTTLQVNSFAVVSDPDAHTVAGTTDALVVTDTLDLTQTLSLWPAGSSAYDPGKTVLAPGGSFYAANPFYQRASPVWGEIELDWEPGQQGFLRYLDAAGNAVFDTFNATSPDPILRLRGSGSSYVADNYVRGTVYGACASGSVTLLDAANSVKAQANTSACPSFSISFVDLYGNPLPILSGDAVTANFGGRMTTVKVPNLSMSADASTDIVAGAISPGLVLTTTPGAPQSLAIYADNDGGPAQNVQPDAGGAFSADFSGEADIQPGTQGAAQYIDAAGNRVFAPWQAPFDKPVLHLRGYGRYRAENFVAVSLPGSSCSNEGIELVVKAPDGAVRRQASVPICGRMVSLFLADEFGNTINLNPGDLVQATFAGRTAAATVPSLTVLSDAQSDTVSGVTDAGVLTITAGLTQTLAVWPQSIGDEGYGKHVLLAAGGVFSATNPFYDAADAENWWSEQDLDWNPGDQGQLRYIDASGNYVYSTFAARLDQPRLGIQKDGNQVSGQLPESYAAVTVTVQSAAAAQSGVTVKGSGYATTDLTGYFSLSVFDGAGNPLTIAEGDEVVLAQPPATVAVPPLTITADVENERMTGKGPANALLNVYIVNALSRAVTTDANGDYALDLRGFADLHSNDLIGVEYRNAQGFLVWYERYAGTAISAALHTNRVWGYAPDRQLPVTVTVKRGGALIGADSFVNNTPYFTAFPVNASGQPIVLAPADVVEVDFGAGVVHSLTLAGLGLAVNEQTNLISGSGPANGLLALSAAAFPDWYEASVAVGAGGQWSVDLAAQMRDVRPGDMASVRYSSNGSDMTWLYAVAPVFWLRSADNTIRGYAAPYAPLAITLKRNGSVLASGYTLAGAFGAYSHDLYDGNRLPAPIAAGDVVEVKSTQPGPVTGPVAGPVTGPVAGLVTVSVTVPVMEIVLNGPARTVSGVGPANALLGLFTAAGNRTVQTDAAGVFSASFAAQTSAELAWAELRYREPQGNWIDANVVQKVGGAPYLFARWDVTSSTYGSNVVSGSVGAGPRLAKLTLRRGGQLVALTATGADRQGNFGAAFLDGSNQPVSIEAGDLIEVVSGDVSKSMTVLPLTVRTNQESSTLFGAGPANAPLEATGCGGTTVDPTGAWVVACSGASISGGRLYVADLAGNRTYLAWSIPRIFVPQNATYLYGTVSHGANVKVQLLRRGAVVAEANTKATTDNGSFLVQFFAGNRRVFIEAGDVVAIDAGQPITVPVGPLSALIDTVNDKVTGIGPASQSLYVVTTASVLHAMRRVTTAADGSYTADFSGEADLRGGVLVALQYANAEGHQVSADWRASQVRINLASDIVDGYTRLNARAMLALKRGGSILATTQVQTGLDGSFSAFFLDGSGSLVDLMVGDVIEVTAGSPMGGATMEGPTMEGPTMVATAVPLTANLDPATDRVTGTAPPGALLLVVAYNCFLQSAYSSQQTVIAGADGSYTADFSDRRDLDLTSYAYVQGADAEGNLTSTATLPAEEPLREDAEISIAATGASLIMSFFGTANGGNLTPPQAFNLVGGGRLVVVGRGGDLIITGPDGAIMRSRSDGYFEIENPRSGVWQLQVETWNNDPGFPYQVAAGVAQYNVYMPAIKRQ